MSAGLYNIRLGSSQGPPLPPFAPRRTFRPEAASCRKPRCLDTGWTGHLFVCPYPTVDQQHLAVGNSRDRPELDSVWSASLLFQIGFLLSHSSKHCISVRTRKSIGLRRQRATPIAANTPNLDARRCHSHKRQHPNLNSSLDKPLPMVYCPQDLSPTATTARGRILFSAGRVPGPRCVAAHGRKGCPLTSTLRLDKHVFGASAFAAWWPGPHVSRKP